MMLTEPKTALAGVMLDISFARFKVSMATFNEERVNSRGFCRREWGFMGIGSAWGERMLYRADNYERQLRKKRKQ